MHKFIKISIIAILLLTAVKLYSQVLTPEEIYEKVNDAVVVIIAYDFNNEPTQQGSGVVLNDKGYVVTNYHVFAGCERLEIKHYDKTIPYSDIIGVDVEKDLLILKIEDNIFPSIQLANVDELKVGQRVYAIGSPLGFENSMSEGIISGLRNVYMLGRSFIQITASISPGSSGGAVVNSKGELIGISSLTFTEGQNLNFAIPVSDILSLKIGSYSDKDSIENFNLFYKGRNALESENYYAAIKYYDEFLKKILNNAVAYYNRGLAYANLEKYNEAISDFTTAISIGHPNIIDAYYNRGRAYFNLQKYNEAITDFTTSISIDPNYAEAYGNRGNAYGNLQKYNEAIADYTTAISKGLNDDAAYYNRGRAYFNLQKYNEAISDFTTAISIDPNDAAAYYNRGSAYGNIQKYSEAISDFTTSISIDPNDAYAYGNRGNAYGNLQKYNEAIADYTIAISIDPYLTDSYFARGLAYANLKKSNEAISDFTTAISIGHPNIIRAYYNRGIAYDELQKYDKAISDYTSAINIDPDYVDAYYNRGRIYYLKGNCYNAKKDLEKVIDLDPSYESKLRPYLNDCK